MKPILFGLMAVLFLFPAATRADHHEVFVQGVHRLDSSACAVQLQIDQDTQNGFEGVDRIEVNGVLLASLGDLTASAINSGGHVNTGDNILFASDSFQSRTGLVPDVVFPDVQCNLFVANAVFAFVIDDPDFGVPPVTINTLTASSQFGSDNTSMTKSSEDATPQFVDLDNNTLTVSNNAGTDVVIGNSGNDGGCAMFAPSTSHSPNGWLFCFIGIPLLWFFRVGRCQKIMKVSARR